MTVSDYFKMGRIFDRRRIDKLRKVRRSRSSSPEAAPRPDEAATPKIGTEDGLAIPDELEPVKDGSSASNTGAPGSEASVAAGDIDAAANDIAAGLELPRPPPPSCTTSPSRVGAVPVPLRPDADTPSHTEEVMADRQLSEVSEDVPWEGTFLTHGSTGGIRGRAWSEPASEDNFFTEFECRDHTAEAGPDPILTASSFNGPARPSSASTAPSSGSTATAPASCVLCLVGDSLELMMAPGDVLAVKGQGRLTEIGTAHGMLGHVLLVLSPPNNVLRNSDEGESLQAVWPHKEVEEIWKVRTLESTRSEQGLHEAEMLLYVERNTGQLILIGELQNDGTLVLTEHESVELWQSPAELRSQLRVDLMSRVLSDMKANEASWSHLTVARAMFSSANLTSGPGTQPEQTLETVKACWVREPICTSVVITFWQRYLCELASCSEDNHHQHSLDLIMRWMPLKADRGLPGDLLGAMRSVGWVTVGQVPRIFRPMVFATPGTSQKSQHGYSGQGGSLLDDDYEVDIAAA